jgi:hypothetical protein
LESLSPFLHAVFQERQKKWWWIDSICINQDDDHEKSFQIPQMGETFQKADKGVVWLGEKTPDSDKAMAFLEFLGNEFYRHGLDVEFFTSTYYRSHWTALESLINRAW